jgi:hypothetical protein
VTPESIMATSTPLPVKPDDQNALAPISRPTDGIDEASAAGAYEPACSWSAASGVIDAIAGFDARRPTAEAGTLAAKPSMTASSRVMTPPFA